MQTKKQKHTYIHTLLNRVKEYNIICTNNNINLHQIHNLNPFEIKIQGAMYLTESEIFVFNNFIFIFVILIFLYFMKIHF